MKYEKDFEALKKEYRRCEEELMVQWDEYAIEKTIEYDRQKAYEEGFQIGLREAQKKIKKDGEAWRFEAVGKLLNSGKVSIVKIAKIVNVTEAFVRKVKKEIK